MEPYTVKCVYYMQRYFFVKVTNFIARFIAISMLDFMLSIRLIFDLHYYIYTSFLYQKLSIHILI